MKPHSSFYGRLSLALDLVEEFRPIIVDSVVLSMLNNRMLTPTDFVVEVGAYRLKDTKRKIFFTKLRTYAALSYKPGSLANI